MMDDAFGNGKSSKTKTHFVETVFNFGFIYPPLVVFFRIVTRRVRVCFFSVWMFERYDGRFFVCDVVVFVAFVCSFRRRGGAIERRARRCKKSFVSSSF